MNNNPPALLNHQQVIAENGLKNKIFLQGICGTGKTTAGVARLRALLSAGVPAREILILTPQRTLSFPYLEFTQGADMPAGTPVTVTTLAGLSRQMIELFFPLVAQIAGFAQPTLSPVFLSLETAQYYMTRLLSNLIDERGYFESVRVERNRIYSQILDNLNKAALVGFPADEIGQRLKSAHVGDTAQERVYEDVQTCALLFREYCLQHNLLDFSLQAELFTRHIWKLPECRQLLTTQYRHLLIDNIEEDNPALHDLCREWLPLCDSALIIYDEDGGFRRFLGADDRSAYQLKVLCDTHIRFDESLNTPPELHTFAREIGISLERFPPESPAELHPLSNALLEDHRYFPQMIDHVAEQIAGLVHEQGIPPAQIVVVAPFVSDALQFALTNRLERYQVPFRTHRPSRALRQEATSRALLTLAKLAHPDWKMKIASADLAYALVTVITGFDLVRAQLLANIVTPKYDIGVPLPLIASFDQIKPEMQARITYLFGERYESLRHWLLTYREGLPEPLDHFWSKLFGEVLSQAGFGFHADFQAAETAANLIDSVRKFRQMITILPEDKTLAQEYVEMVEAGLIADQYLRSWDTRQADAVLVAPAYTFLLQNTPVQHQFWLDVGADGWAQRLYQPLTHPYVLARDWQEGRLWLDDDEVNASQDALYRLITGLVRRCTGTIHLSFSDYSEQGQERRGMLLEAIQRLLFRLNLSAGGITDDTQT